MVLEQVFQLIKMLFMFILHLGVVQDHGKCNHCFRRAAEKKTRIRQAEERDRLRRQAKEQARLLQQAEERARLREERARLRQQAEERARLLQAETQARLHEEINTACETGREYVLKNLKPSQFSLLTTSMFATVVTNKHSRLIPYFFRKRNPTSLLQWYAVLFSSRRIYLPYCCASVVRLLLGGRQPFVLLLTTMTQ